MDGANETPLTRVGDVSARINQCRQFVYDRIQEGVFEAHRRPGSESSNFTVTQRSVDAYALRSALYPPRDLAERLFELAGTLNRDARRNLATRLGES